MVTEASDSFNGQRIIHLMFIYLLFRLLTFIERIRIHSLGPHLYLFFPFDVSLLLHALPTVTSPPPAGDDCSLLLFHYFSLNLRNRFLAPKITISGSFQVSEFKKRCWSSEIYFVYKMALTFLPSSATTIPKVLVFCV